MAIYNRYPNIQYMCMYRACSLVGPYWPVLTLLAGHAPGRSIVKPGRLPGVSLSVDYELWTMNCAPALVLGSLIVFWFCIAVVCQECSVLDYVAVAIQCAELSGM